MTVDESLRPRIDIDRLCMSKNEGGRVIASIEDSVDGSVRQLKDDVKN